MFDCYCGLWNSLSHGLSIFQEGKGDQKDTLKLETNAESSKVLSIFLLLFYTSIVFFSVMVELFMKFEVDVFLFQF